MALGAIIAQMSEPSSKETLESSPKYSSESGESFFSITFFFA